MYRVHVTDGSVPAGTFDLELTAPADLTLAVFDIVSLASDPAITVSASPDGVTFTPASSVSLNGYRINAWFPPVAVRFLRLTIAPTHPDTLGGTSFTFGLTDFTAAAVSYYLASDLYFRALTFAPGTSQMRFQAASVPGLAYYLSLNGGTFARVLPGDLLTSPAVSPTTITASLHVLFTSQDLSLTPVFTGAALENVY